MIVLGSTKCWRGNDSSGSGKDDGSSVDCWDPGGLVYFPFFGRLWFCGAVGEVDAVGTL